MPDRRPPPAGAIVDNVRRRVGDVLGERIDDGARLSIVSAYFTIYAFAELRGALARAAHTRFLLPWG